jgi:hypothetical protein
MERPFHESGDYLVAKKTEDSCTNEYPIFFTSGGPRTAHQARSACFDACAPKVTVLQSPTAQRYALRGTQCQ